MSDNICARDIMNKNPATCFPNNFILQVCNILKKRKTTHIIVVNKKNQPVGIFSYRDLTLFKCVMGMGLKGILKTEVSDLMTVPWCAYEDTKIKNIFGFISHNDMNAIPVVDHEKKLKGAILKNNIFEYIHKLAKSNPLIHNKLTKIKAKYVMNSKVISCNPNTPALKVDKIMAKNRIGHIPIVTQNKVVGIVSFTDLNILNFNPKEGRMIQSKIENFMSKNVCVVDKNENLEKIISLMIEKNIGSVVVVDNLENKKLIGIIGRRDVYKVLERYKIY